MKKVLPTLFFFLQFSICFGQKQKTEKLSVGDIVPETELRNILNYPSITAKTSDFRGKLLILDFWATWCTPCIASFPKLKSLSAKFGNKLQILGVTEEENETVSKFFAKMKKEKQAVLPASVTDDKALSRFFFHTTVPHYVWIDEKGKVIAITESKDVNETNITTYFRKGKFDYVLKEDESGQVVGMPRFMQSVLFEKNGTREIKKLDSSRLTVHSVLTKYIEGITDGGQFAPAGYIFWGNCTIMRLYKTAFYGSSFRILNASPSTILVEVPDSALYTHITSLAPGGKQFLSPGRETEVWLKDNGYSYELNVPLVLADEKYKIMLDQLNLYFGAVFGIEGVVEKRNNKYLALVRTSNLNKIGAQGGEEKSEMTSFYLKIQNSSLQVLVNNLVLPLQLYPMIENETGYNEKVSIELNCQLSDLKALNSELLKYDLQVIEKEKEMTVGVIRRKKL